MNVKDKRTVREQIVSGFRIGGSMVLAFGFFMALTLSTMVSLGRGDYSGLDFRWRIPGVILLAALSAVLFFTSRYWAKWVVGIVAYVLARSLFGAPIFLLVGNFTLAKQLLVCLVFSTVAALLTWRYHDRAPLGLEKTGLVAFVLCAPFALALESIMPLVVGLALLALAEFGERLRRDSKRNRSKASRPHPLHIG